MGQNFHESYDVGAVAPPSERSTGLVFAGVAVIFAVIFREDTFLTVCALSLAPVLVAMSLLDADLLKPLNKMWFKLSLFLHKFMNPLIMFVLFAVVIVPAGFIMNKFRDPLRRSKATRDERSYWILRYPSAEEESSMENQF